MISYLTGIRGHMTTATLPGSGSDGNYRVNSGSKQTHPLTTITANKEREKPPRMRRLFVTILLLLLSLPTHAQQAELLHYRLSYSGFITGYIWKELADVTINLTPEATTYREQPAAQLTMEVTTKGYSLAETLRALRYKWVSILDPELQRSLLVRVVDKGDNDSHEVFWYDWEKRNISSFHKRERQDASIPIFDEQPRLEWETNQLPAPPAFIDPFPRVGAEEFSYLIMDKQKLGLLQENAIDPVSMLLRLRHHDYKKQPALDLAILLENDLAPYRAKLLEREHLDFDDKEIPCLKIEVRRSNEEGEEGAMWMWLSDDARRLPLRLDVEAPLGMLHIELQEVETATDHSNPSG